MGKIVINLIIIILCGMVGFGIALLLVVGMFIRMFGL